MNRRDLLHLLSGAAAAGLLTGCNRREPTALAFEPPRAAIRAICFDLFTLFDPRTVVSAARTVVGDAAEALCEAWRLRQFQYAFLRVAGGRYADFRQVTADALEFAARARGLAIGAPDRERLVDACSELEPWPDTRSALEGFRAAGLRLAPLANYAPAMLDALLDGAGLGAFFEARISTHAASTFKPDPRAYALGVATLGLPREEIAFAAFGGWDAAGARWYGYPTFWVNRLGVPSEELPPGAHATGPGLAGLAAFVSSWGSGGR